MEHHGNEQDYPATTHNSLSAGPLLRKFELEGKDDADLYGLPLDEGGLMRGLTHAGRPMNRVEFSEESAVHDRFKVWLLWWWRVVDG